ncbi:DoxX family protein [Streptosporangiaceae bacterium NEAU-GS5]|nr:DoxX family protein [Streptosporangiaceae bacterium NEAU-GS5]
MKKTLQDLAVLAARLGVGGIFFANGWHKLEAGLNATSAQFGKLGAPIPGFWAAATMLIELLGGALLIAGLGVAAIGLLLFAEALAVFILSAGDADQPLAAGDTRLVVALGAASVMLAVAGAGRLSVDHMVVIKRREAVETADERADAEADWVISGLREPKKASAGDTGSSAATGSSGSRGATGSTGGATGGGTAAGGTGGGASPKGPVTFPASSPDDREETVSRVRPRRPSKRGEETTTETRSEAPAARSSKDAKESKDVKGRAAATDSTAPAAESADPAKPAPGDTLVAGRRSPETRP